MDRSLTASDTELAHAWALKKLVNRYSDSEERLLKTESQDKLREMLRTHLTQLADANAGLDPLIQLLPGSRTQKPDVPGDWRTGILALFARVQQQDSLVASLVVGTQANGQDAAAASESLRSVHQAIGPYRGTKLSGSEPAKYEIQLGLVFAFCASCASVFSQNAELSSSYGIPSYSGVRALSNHPERANRRPAEHTNASGFYSLPLWAGSIPLSIRAMGFETILREDQAGQVKPPGWTWPDSAIERVTVHGNPR